jgi:isopenicillin N synthase-like dioxygenase
LQLFRPPVMLVEILQSGHLSATIFVGSVLSYMTGGTTRAAKHRVMYSSKENHGKRMASTLFVHPRGTARLVVPPSPRFEDVVLKKQTTFDAWSSRVSRN